MKPIGDYRYLCDEVTVEQFLADDPPAVLLHHAALSAFSLLDGAAGSTRNRLALGDDPVKRVPGSVPRAEAYIVLPLESKTGSRQGRLLMGCGTTCDVYIDDATLSREHAWIEQLEDGYVLCDNGAAAGTRLNGVVLYENIERPLCTGDRITLGAVELIFLLPVEFYQFARRFLLGKSG